MAKVVHELTKGNFEIIMNCLKDIVNTGRAINYEEVKTLVFIIDQIEEMVENWDNVSVYDNEPKSTVFGPDPKTCSHPESIYGTEGSETISTQEAADIMNNYM